MFNDLRLKAMVRKVSNEYSFSYDDKILAYISMFDHEPKKYHDQIKTYIREFAPKIWEEFNEYITINNMTNIIKNKDESDDEPEHLSLSLDDLLKRLK